MTTALLSHEKCPGNGAFLHAGRRNADTQLVEAQLDEAYRGIYESTTGECRTRQAIMRGLFSCASPDKPQTHLCLIAEVEHAVKRVISPSAPSLLLRSSFILTAGELPREADSAGVHGGGCRSCSKGS